MTGRRGDVLAVLRASSAPMSIDAIAEQLGVHRNTVRFHLDGLGKTGQVQQVSMPPTRRGRPPLTFSATRRMDPAGPTNYRLLAGILVGGLAHQADGSRAAVELGRVGGAGLFDEPDSHQPLTDDQAAGRLTELLDDIGFDPERRRVPTGNDIALHHCPFLDLVDTRADIVCALHLGLMQGALSRLNDSSVVELEPFVESDLCLVHLGTPS
ncbi:MAG: helix-turn-helix transcriptional regulator [Nakamurella sp.]